MSPKALAVALKELKEALRDKRTIRTAIIFPGVLVFALFFLQGQIVKNVTAKMEKEILKVYYIGERDLLEHLRKVKGIEVEEFAGGVEGLKEAVRKKRCHVGVSFDGRKAKIYFSPERLKSVRASNLVSKAINAYRKRLVERKLKEYGVPKGVLYPFNVVEVSLSEESAEKAVMSKQFGVMLALFLVIVGASSATYASIDATAGEKERKTLEILLAQPISVQDVALGKLVGTWILGNIGTVVMLVAFPLAFSLLAGEMMGGERLNFWEVVSAGKFIQIIIIAFALNVFTISLQLLAGLRARTFKEAQQYIGIANAVYVVPLAFLNVVFIFMEKTPVWLYAIPVVGQFSFIMNVLSGEAGFAQFTFALAATLFYSAIMLRLLVNSYSKEEIILRV